MATKKIIQQEEPRKTPTQLRAENAALKEEIERLQETTRCSLCGKQKSTKNHFYQSSDPRVGSRYSHVCKKCATEIACRKDEDGNLHEPTKASVMLALEYLDKPFLTRIWDSSYFEAKNNPNMRSKSGIWGFYIKNIQMDQYKGMRWKDSDIFKRNGVVGKLDAALPSVLEEEEFEKERQQQLQVLKESEINKKDVINAIGYDPFENYPNSADIPMLYGSLISFIDEESKNDGMKMRAIIQIVKTYNQIEKINDTIDNYVNDAANLINNVPSLDKLSGIVSRLNSSAVSLAKDNGISVNNNNNKSKGANTLSGKIKQLSEIGFRSAKINTFDYETCEGMRQVAELSEEARHKQIGYDENIAQEIKDIKVELVETLTKERDAALETLRLLRVENMDLKVALGISGEQ